MVKCRRERTMKLAMWAGVAVLLVHFVKLVKAEPGVFLHQHPDISIAGLSKCGTTQLWKMLRSHSEVNAFKKEHCPKGTHISNLNLYSEWIQQQKMMQDPGKASVNSCTNPFLANVYLNFAKAHDFDDAVKPPKFIYLVREPADLLWSAYNYWTNPTDTEKNLPTRWTTSETYRSPEHFQTLLEGGNRILGGINVTTQMLRIRYRLDTLDRLIKDAGKENVLLVNSELLESKHVPWFLPKLAQFTGLSVDGFDKEILRTRANSGLSLSPKYKGILKESQKSEIPKGVYEVSGYKPMLSESFELINSRSREFCQEMAHKYNVVFKHCLSSRSPRLMRILDHVHMDKSSKAFEHAVSMQSIYMQSQSLKRR